MLVGLIELLNCNLIRRFSFSHCSDVDIEAQFSINQSRADEITMREDYSSFHMPLNDDGFGDIGFDGSDFIRDGGVDVRLMVVSISGSDK